MPVYQREPATVPPFGTVFEMAPTAVAVESPFDCVDDGVAVCETLRLCHHMPSGDNALTCDEPVEEI